MKVYVKTPARLHLGIIDLNGELGRIYGGLGVAVNQPNVVITAEKAKTLTVTGEKAELTRKYASQFLAAYKINDKASICVKQAIPEHVGLGSGTQMALAVAEALAHLYDTRGSTEDFAVALGRTAQSGIGTAVFAQGGLAVDAGKNTRDPTKKAIPAICHMPFPDDWRFVVAIPNVTKGLASEAEAEAFKQLPPMPATEVGKICRLIILKLLPAIPELDIESFGAALTEVQHIVGDSFAAAQGGRYSSNPSGQCIEFMLANGAYGAGQSSWGPTVYGVVREEEAKALQAKVQGFLDGSVGGQVIVAKANNHGATVRVLK